MSIYCDRADLYDAAFSWDVTDEVRWLVRRWGQQCRSVLEPGCGSGRLFVALRAHGIEPIGLDLSPEMIARARQRMEAADQPIPALYCADMASFDLPVIADAALCPINTFGYLQSPADARSHLRCVANHLRPGARYLVQVDLLNPDRDLVYPQEPTPWEMEADGLRVRASWIGVAFAAHSSIESQRSRIEVLDGPERGLVLEEDHATLRWTWAAWSELIASSPFTQIAAYDGTTAARTPCPLDATLANHSLTWHELALESTSTCP